MLWIPALVLAGCVAVGPDYSPPEIEEPVNWHSPLDDGLRGEAVDTGLLAQWWTTLNDPQLTDFIQRALEGNLDLGQARARVRQARASRGIAAADRFPGLGLGASLKRSRASEDSGTGSERDLYQTGFDAGWELDLFGGIERGLEAADANLEASREALTHAWVTLAAEVARNYVDVRSYQARLAIARANLAAQQESFDMVQKKFQAGIVSALDLEQARYNLETTRANIPFLHTGLVRAQNRLAVLLGETPGSLELDQEVPIPVTPLEIAVGIPADLLRRRPDVRQAERELAARTARIGVATAKLYPSLSLTGSIGLEALSDRNLFRTGSTTYGLGPNFSWNIFNAGAVRQSIKVETALQEQALIHYEAVILLALEEVENALTGYAQEQVRRGALEKAAGAARAAADIAQNQYRAGLIDFQNVLEAQRSLLSLQDQLAQSREAVVVNLVSLYKALGGGWNPLAPSLNYRKTKP
ncbi:MAG: efflux transporter outer membrane subunit [Desulfobacteraceae bacterium]|nr:efflux transporter outer membrane subunit [Desulfobacteraceae bacterium]